MTAGDHPVLDATPRFTLGNAEAMIARPRMQLLSPANP